MCLNLVDRRRNYRAVSSYQLLPRKERKLSLRREKSFDLGSCKVANANTSNFTLFNQSFHCFPCISYRDIDDLYST